MDTWSIMSNSGSYPPPGDTKLLAKPDYLIMHHPIRCNSNIQHVDWKPLMSLLTWHHIFVQQPNIHGSMRWLLNLLVLHQISLKMCQNGLMQHEFPPKLTFLYVLHESAYQACSIDAHFACDEHYLVKILGKNVKFWSFWGLSIKNQGFVLWTNLVGLFQQNFFVAECIYARCMHLANLVMIKQNLGLQFLNNCWFWKWHFATFECCKVSHTLLPLEQWINVRFGWLLLCWIKLIKWHHLAPQLSNFFQNLTLGGQFSEFLGLPP